MEGILRKMGRVSGVHVEPFHTAMPFVAAAEKFAGMPGTVVLLSGSDLDCARYHILAVLPWMSVTATGRRLTIQVDDASWDMEENPFTGLRRILDQCRLPASDSSLPVTAGLFGYFAYDLKDCLECLPRTSMDDLGLPHLRLFAPQALLIEDRLEGRTFLCIPEREGMKAQAVRNQFLRVLENPLSDLPDRSSLGHGAGSIRSNFSRERYLQTVETIKDYIAAGDVYQVNLSQRFQAEFSGDPYRLFQSLFERNPAPFFAFIQAGDHQIISTSPERFVRQQGRRVETRPIKGTVPRGKTPEEDAAMKQALTCSKKDDAELSMIVDLLRNDLGKVCEGGSVRVAAHKRLETYQNVHHLVSTVEGVLSGEYDSVDLLCATFPGGSITGCPKIRAMEIIDELEPCRRHVYTGAIGYVGFGDTMDLSIAIRTATVIGGQILYAVGGGIVMDSHPPDEYEETLHKGRTLMDQCKSFEQTSCPPMVWRNGRMEPAAEACIPASHLGVAYGFGFFETIRFDRGEPRYLNEHLARFSSAWRRLFPGPFPDLSWREIITRVVAANGLEHRTAAVKVLAAYGSRPAPPFDYHLMVSARPYIHRLTEKKTAGLRLATCEEPRQTPLADCKTANYLFYYLAGKRAAEKGADEALILNADGSISETNTANILLIRDHSVVLPVSGHVLPGIMQAKVLEVLAGWGFAVRNEKLFPEDLFRADTVLITNALMGAVPGFSLDGRQLTVDVHLCARINARVL